jgi:hypothetical protein
MVYLTIDGEEIETTPWHPFYTDEGWEDAGDLEPGDLILALDGDYGTVESIVIVAETQTMYDLDVAIVDTFAVGDGAWVVHNCENLGINRSDFTIVELGAGDYANAISWKGRFPSHQVIATNDPQEWMLGSFYYRNNTDLDTFPPRMYEGWLKARNSGVIVEGPMGAIPNLDPRLNQVADVVYTVLPYPSTARGFATRASEIVRRDRDSLVALVGTGSLRDQSRFNSVYHFVNQFQQLNPQLIMQSVNGRGVFGTGGKFPVISGRNPVNWESTDYSTYYFMLRRR